MTKPLIIGHRGAMGTAPENTAVSFEKAINKGADGVEFDVHMTRDARLVVIHDERIDRTSDGSGLVKDLTLKELKQYDFGSHFDSAFAGQKILTLEEALEITLKCDVINIEIKNGPIFYEGIEEKVLKVVKDFDVERKVIISSFNHYTIHKIAKLAPDIMRGVLYMEGLFQPWEYAKTVGANAVHPYYLSIIPDEIRRCHENGIAVNVFGTNDDYFFEMFIKAGVDIIITDFPERALRVRRKMVGE